MGLQAPSCCRVEPAADHGAPVAARRALQTSWTDAGTTAWDTAGAAPALTLAHQLTSAPPLPDHGGPPPLYLQHSAILR